MKRDMNVTKDMHVQSIYCTCINPLIKVEAESVYVNI